MLEQSGLTKILLFFSGRSCLGHSTGSRQPFFVISLIRRLLKQALVLVFVMVGVYYYVEGEATAFWAGQSDTLQEAMAEVGHDAGDRGLEFLKEVADGDLAQRAGALKQELQVRGPHRC